MQTSVRRAAAFALVATLSLAVPSAGALAAVPFALIAVIGRVVSDGPVFELFARPQDRIEGQLRGLVGFALAATGLALLASLSGLPDGVFVATLLVVGYGNLVDRMVAERRDDPMARVTGFIVGGAVAAIGGSAASAAIAATPIAAVDVVFLSITAGLAGALFRAVLAENDDPIVMVSMALLLWVLAALSVPAEPTRLAIAVVVAGGFGYLSWLLGTASVTGMLTGVLIGMLTIVLGGYGWFVVLIAFFGFGGLASKFRYEDKLEYGVAEANEGARGGRNVLGNAAVALGAVVGHAAGVPFAVEPSPFVFAFAGSIATAMSDTLSSEIGVLFDEPRLITTLEPVDPGTDGGVTLEGGIAGAAGAAIVGALALLLLDVGPGGAVAVVVAGVVGMIADSVLGATLEGRWIGNQAVNFLATLVGAVIGAGFGVLTLV